MREKYVGITFVTTGSQNLSAGFCGHELAIRKSNCTATPGAYRALLGPVPTSPVSLLF